MSLGQLFDVFIQKSPVTVLMRATIEAIFSPKNLDAIFQQHAVKQYAGPLLFSTVFQLLCTVVWKQRRSVRDAYNKELEVDYQYSIRSIYNKLNGTETQVCRGLVKETAGQLTEVVQQFQRKQNPLLRGFQIRILDGNHLPATDHRLKVLRKTASGPLPGQAIAVLDPDRKLIVDLFPCEDGEAQERRILPAVIATVVAGELWLGDRNFCTTKFLFGVADNGGHFLVRQHKSTLTWNEETKLKKVGRCDSGTLYEQTLSLLNDDKVLRVRRIVVKLDKPTRDGETEIALLTNLPVSLASAKKVAALYWERWTIENAFQEIEQSLRSEINTLGYPGAALLGLAIAMVTYNALSVTKWAIASEHSETIERSQISSYYMTSTIASDYAGMMLVLPPAEWTKRFGALSPRELARELKRIARHVRIEVYRKTTRAEKKPKPKRTSGKWNHHVSTAQLLAQAKG